MKAYELYALIGRWRKEMEEAGNMGCVVEMGQVMLELREDMYASEQKSAGKSGKAIVTAAKRIVKSAKATKRDNISGVFANIDKDGTKHWCVCDGYVGVRFNEPIPLEEADTSKCAPFDMSQVCRMPDNAKELDLPSLAEVKVYAKTNRGTGNRNGSTKPKPMKIDDEIGLWVNPELLINIMECLPDAKAWATTRRGTIYFKADNGDGVLMPTNYNEYNEKKELNK